MLIAFDCRIIRDKNPAGISRVTLEFLKKVLAYDKKNNYMLIFDSLEMKDFVIYHIRHIKKPYKILVVPFGVLTLDNLFRLPKILNERSVDIYYQSYYFVSPFYKKYKTVITVHDLIHFFYPYLKMGFLRRMFHVVRLAPRMIFRRVEKIVTVSTNTSRDLVKMFKVSPKKIRIIHNGVSEHFRPIDIRKARAFMKEKYDISKPYILYVGRNEPHKNIKALILAYTKLPPLIQERHQLILAGKEDPKYSEPIRELIKSHNIEKRVCFTGYVDESDLPFVYSGASVFVFPSFYEGFGIPVLEAMACGAPVVCSNSSSLPEAGGEAALYADPCDIGKFAEHIENVLSNQMLREDLINKGFNQIKNFTWFGATTALLECFNELGPKT